MTNHPTIKPYGQLTLSQRILHEIKKNKYLYIMLIPVIVYFVMFKYLPMTRIVIAFQDFKIFKGIGGSKWVGLANFEKFFKLKDCWRLIRNTLLLSVYSILFHFPIPIILALMINELKSRKAKRLVQTISYMPHFVSVVVVCGLLRNFTSGSGIINSIISVFNPNWSSPNLLNVQGYYRPIHIISSMWQEVGWDSIIYLAALSGVDPQLYEAAYIDGANKLQRIAKVTLPCIVPTIAVQFIMRVGRVMSVGYEKILLLYNPGIYETADVIATYMYRFGLLNGNYSVATAVGLFNSVISIIILVTVNGLFRKFSEESLW